MTALIPPQRSRATTVAIRIGLEPQQVGTQVARLVQAARAPQRDRLKVPYDHGSLFREPVYADGQPYAPDEDEDGE